MKRYLILLLIPLLFAACKKEKNMGRAQEKLFEESILNQNFVVSYADDNGIILTKDYKGYVFILSKIDYYHGPMKAIKDGITYAGTWKSNDDYGKLTIAFRDSNAELQFLSREWRFKSKSFTLLELAPWGQRDGINVHMKKK